MSAHVFARIAGHRLAIVPQPCYEIARADHPSAVDVRCRWENRWLWARITPDNGEFIWQLGEGTASLADVLDVVTGPDLDDWRIETSRYLCAWPSGFRIQATDFPRSPSVFDLIGPGGSLVYVQSPNRKIPAIEELVAPGQEIVGFDRGELIESVELAYTHDGEPWRQRHLVLTRLGREYAVSMQCRAGFADVAIAAATLVATSLVPSTE